MPVLGRSLNPRAVKARIFEEPSLTNADSAPTLHVFRAILRECTYLPDPTSRTFFHDYVVARFRAYCPRPLQDKRQSFKRTFTVLERRPKLLKQAQRGLHMLQRGNHGHPQSLVRVLALTYGRIGPRRHELLKELKIPDSPVGIGALQDALQNNSDPVNQHVPHPSRQLRALLTSQIQFAPDAFSGKPVRRPDVRIPETNAWGRPLPIKRVRNIKRRWYADVLDRIMPPLPEREWDMLRQLASGEKKFDGAVPRRGPSGEQGVGLDSYRPLAKLSRPHVLNARYMRRTWAKTFQQCPTMRSVPHQPSGWDTIWSKSPGVPICLDLDTSDSNGFFDGVDENGKIKNFATG